ncbi:TOMM precursor leader peptide-binding protein [Halopiger goleimassiliensis]|uniref:TOMM precursor leader peptide-binding protein n=1 Tax=Halopiger goleimassiliensis TaxID=1293048 RepID=UPI0006780821|nr:TOMM precursor leader peptide-binding protein [Halopiger goleimassiliensis]
MAENLEGVHPAINPIFVPLKISDNEIEFRVGPFAGAKHTIKDSDEEGTIAELLEYIDGRSTVSEILDQFDEEHREEIRSVVATLLEKKALIDVSDRDPNSLWSYSTLADRVSDEELDRLRTATVGVVTRGRIGAMVAADLAETGVDRVQLLDVDDDRRGIVESIDGVVTHTDTVDSLVSNVEYVVYADNTPGMDFAKRVNERAVETDTPLTVGHVLGIEAIVGPTIVPGQTPCLSCLLERWRMNQTASENYQAFIESVPDQQRVHLPSHSRIVGGLVAKEATTQLLTGHGYVVGRTLDIDLVSMNMETNEIMKMPRCDVCGASSENWQRLIDPEAFKYD